MHWEHLPVLLKTLESERVCARVRVERITTCVWEENSWMWTAREAFRELISTRNRSFTLNKSPVLFTLEFYFNYVRSGATWNNASRVPRDSNTNKEAKIKTDCRDCTSDISRREPSSYYTKCGTWFLFVEHRNEIHVKPHCVTEDNKRRCLIKCETRKSRRISIRYSQLNRRRLYCSQCTLYFAIVRRARMHTAM